MNWGGLPIFIALGPVDMRMGRERLGGCVIERMKMQPRGRALFVFVGKRGHTIKILTADSSGVIVVSKYLDSGRFEVPTATSAGQQYVVVSDAIFAAIFAGTPVTRRVKQRRSIH